MGMKNIFWNANQERLRAGWRIVTQLILMTVFLAIFQAMKNLAIRYLMNPEPELAGIEVANFLTQVGSNLVIVAAVFISVKFLDRRRISSLGLNINKKWWADLGFGLFVGGSVIGLIFAFEWAFGWLQVTGTFSVPEGGILFLPGIFMPLFGYAAVGLAEEIWIRGYVMTNLSEGIRNIHRNPAWSLTVASILQALLFGLLHAGNRHASIRSTVNISLAALTFALGYLLTGQLAIPIGFHIAWNFFQGNVFGFPVSGTGSQVAQIFSIQQSGPTLWTGGDFGPEAGLLGTIGLMISCAAFILWNKFRYQQMEKDPRISEFPSP